MRRASPRWASENEIERIARDFPTYREFVDDALFDREWGYYGSGRVWFGHRAHFDTFPLALSPFFGRMLAQYAHRLWRRLGSPDEFEICEIGGGNGQLCADCLLWIWERARHEATWKRLAAAARYRIIERSSALIDRQRELLGPLGEQVIWCRMDVGAATSKGAPFADAGLVFSNEVLDCQAHHKVVTSAGRPPGVVYVVPRRGAPDGAPITRKKLGAILGDANLRRTLQFEEVLLPLRTVSGLEPLLRGYHADVFSSPAAAHFVCPSFEPLMRNAARLYERGELLWIDYGEEGSFHRTARVDRRVFAGRPGSHRDIFEAPGHDDISFLVDFSAVAEAGRRAGLEIRYYGPQGELARRSGIRLDRSATELMVRTRALGWLLAIVGVGPEHRSQRASLGWGETDSSQVPVRSYVRRSIAEFLGKRRSQFKLMIMGLAPRGRVTRGRGSRTKPADPEARKRRAV
jgi:SAM-dependent MidA family methyltransferase